jgi:hypothetical protein
MKREEVKVGQHIFVAQHFARVDVGHKQHVRIYRAYSHKAARHIK